MKYLIPIIIIAGLVFLAGCQVQTETKTKEVIKNNNSTLKVKVGEEFLLNNSNIEQIGQESKIDGCRGIGKNYSCQFMVSMVIDKEASKRFAQMTYDNYCIEEEYKGRGEDKTLECAEWNSTKVYLKFFLDSSLIDKKRIGGSVMGKEIEQLTIDGLKKGSTMEEAYNNTRDFVNKISNIKIS